MELRGKKKKCKSKQNSNFGKGDALNLAQDIGKQILTQKLLLQQNLALLIHASTLFLIPKFLPSKVD